MLIKLFFFPPRICNGSQRRHHCHLIFYIYSYIYRAKTHFSFFDVTSLTIKAGASVPSEFITSHTSFFALCPMSAFDYGQTVFSP